MSLWFKKKITNKCRSVKSKQNNIKWRKKSFSCSPLTCFVVCNNCGKIYQMSRFSSVCMCVRVCVWLSLSANSTLIKFSEKVTLNWRVPLFKWSPEEMWTVWEWSWVQCVCLKEDESNATKRNIFLAFL